MIGENGIELVLKAGAGSIFGLFNLNNKTANKHENNFMNIICIFRGIVFQGW